MRKADGTVAGHLRKDFHGRRLCMEMGENEAGCASIVDENDTRPLF